MKDGRMDVAWPSPADLGEETTRAVSDEDGEKRRHT